MSNEDTTTPVLKAVSELTEALIVHCLEQKKSVPANEYEMFVAQVIASVGLSVSDSVFDRCFEKPLSEPTFLDFSNKIVIDNPSTLFH